ncbi:2-phospho-L-lactate guanylyltransferase [Halomonas denitrificans]|uniref:2-phospho-L-lactate guanylyltransferase n=1 Tax=Halomonas denitrificans TaxID=370769 RepID=UPI000D3A8792|nr:2-phospho-L-lactate guanylyltransferase [Halomonas denitrificans]
MSLDTLIVIPVKDFGEAKSRLGQVLAPDRRSALARRLCERTLAFFRQRLPEHDLLVVTASSTIADLARRYDASVLMEPRPRGLSAAATLAAEWSRRQGYAAQLLIPADIAHLDEAELRQLLDAPRPGPSVLICPASDGGTNALLTTPPDVLPFHFGRNSSEAHRQAAQQQGVPCRMLDLEHLRFDLDTPEDLDTLDSLVRQRSGDAPQELVKLWNLCSTRHPTPSSMTPWATWLTIP